MRSFYYKLCKIEILTYGPKKSLAILKLLNILFALDNSKREDSVICNLPLKPLLNYLKKLIVPAYLMSAFLLPNIKGIYLIGHHSNY